MSFTPFTPGGTVFSPWDDAFGAFPDVVDHTAALQKMATAVQAAGGGIINFPSNQVFNLFNGVTAPTDQFALFNFSGLNNITIRLNGSKFVTPANLNGTNGATPLTVYLFYFANCDDVDMEYDVEQTVYNARNYVGGFIGAVFQDTCRNCRVRGRQLGGKGGVTIDRSIPAMLPRDMRAHNFQINLHTQNVFYPLDVEFNGDIVTASLYTIDPGRSYLAYGISNHNIHIDSNGHAAGYDDVFLKAYGLPETNGMPSDDAVVSNIDIYYKKRNNPGDTQDDASMTIAFDQYGSSYNNPNPTTPYYPARISNVKIIFDIDDTGMTAPSQGLIFIRSGFKSVYDPTTVAHVLEDIDISGVFLGTSGTTGYGTILVDFFKFQGQDPTGIIARNIKFHDIVAKGGGQANLPQMGFDGRCLSAPLILRDIAMDGPIALQNIPPGMLEAANVSSSTFNVGVAAVTTQLVGRNMGRNGNFAINQRGYVSGTTLAAGAYGHDGFKAGAGGAAYTFTQTVPDTTVTITSGSLVQVIEAANVYTTAYMLSWVGTATARVWQGSASGAFSAGALVMMDGVVVNALLVTGMSVGVALNVEFQGGSLTTYQIEKAASGILGPTPFERRTNDLALCQRYYQPSNAALGNVLSGGSLINAVFNFLVPMYNNPTAAVVAGTNAVARDGVGSFNVTGVQTIFAPGRSSCAAQLNTNATSPGPCEISPGVLAFVAEL